MSHCFFEQERLDEVRFVGKWAFGRVGKGYVGIYSQDGFTVGAEGQFAGREPQCAAKENTWLVECGREADWGSFDAFVAALKSAAVEAKDGVITYASPSIGAFVTGWDVSRLSTASRSSFTATDGGQPVGARRFRVRRVGDPAWGR